jgi:hypothetical protein
MAYYKHIISFHADWICPSAMIMILPEHMLHVPLTRFTTYSRTVTCGFDDCMFNVEFTIDVRSSILIGMNLISGVLPCSLSYLKPLYDHYRI